MGPSKTEVNLRKLLAAAPRQDNPAKLVHYITTSRELLEHLGTETTADRLPSISKAKSNEYSEQIEALTSKLTASVLIQPEESYGVVETEDEETSSSIENIGKNQISSALRRRPVAQTQTTGTTHTNERDAAAPIKLDESALAHIEKHRKPQEDLTDDMVVLARQLKESSRQMNQSVQETEKVLDSTERAVEHSLATTNSTNTRAMEVFSESSKTSCLTLLVMFVKSCVFVMVGLLIRAT